MNDESDNPLDSLLSIAIQELDDKGKKHLQEINLFGDCPDSPPSPVAEKSLVHEDSDFDEENDLIREEKLHTRNNDTWKTKTTPVLAQQKPLKKLNTDPDVDPIFGIRIVKPLISSAVLQERMVGRDAVPVSRLKQHALKLKSDAINNWVIAGVIVFKSNLKTSQSGSQYMIWTLSDLKGDLKTVSLFLFSGACKELSKTAIGTVVGILNPSFLEKKAGSKDEAALSINNAQKVLILGQSKDLGFCKSLKKGGEKCNNFVNLSQCEICLYHIKQEYQKCSIRSELQSGYVGRGLVALRNKVLGKNEVFYAGKSYMAIPAKKSKKQLERDSRILTNLNGTKVKSNSLGVDKLNKKKVATNLELSIKQRNKDIKILKQLGIDNYLDSPSKNSSTTVSPLKEIGNKTDDKIVEPTKPTTSTSFVPKLSGSNTAFIDLSVPVVKRHSDKAKIKAINIIKKTGPLQKADPNSTCGSGLKRPIEDIQNNTTKKQKLEENKFCSDRFKKMMEATSQHQDLVEEHDSEEQEKYFKKLEMKERLEEKMLNTYKIECKAVQCLKCKYKSFSASDLCKKEKHPLKVFNAMKRFFKCGDCGNRTVSLDVVPTLTCKNCGGGKWERTSMMKERKVDCAPLSIRGLEQKFVNSAVTDANINLLVPVDECET